MVTLDEEDAQQVIKRLLALCNKYEKVLEQIAASNGRESHVAKRALL